jgi:hypothetical protein
MLSDTIGTVVPYPPACLMMAELLTMNEVPVKIVYHFEW